MRHIESIWYNDIFFYFGTLFLLVLTIFRFKKYTPSLNLVLLLSLLSIVYCYYRFDARIWTFTPLVSFPKIKYADLILLILICNGLLLIKKQKLLPQNDSGSFLDDEPLGKDKVDELGYDEYAERLSNKILASHFNKSFAIGINGRWGLGKTSFIDLLKRNLSGHDFIEVNFNPWNSSNPKSIIQDFFDTIQQVISPHHSSLSRLLIQYSNKLITLDDNAISRSIQATVTFATGFESIDSLFNEINDALKKIGKKIIVFIDDLDRLDKEEIIEVIRLMRNTANFHNTFFIVAYDKNYVTSALEEHNPYNHEKFLEKIFQIEVTLPFFNKDIFRRKLAEKIKHAFPEQYHSSIEREIIGTASMVPTYLNDWLETMRDVTRLTNSLLLNLNRLMGEVEFFDFLRLELLRLKYPAAYELLFKRTNEFLETSRKNDHEFTYQLKSIKKDQRVDAQPAKYSYVFEEYLYDNYKDLSIPLSEVAKIVELIGNIFTSSSTFGTSRTHLSVVHPSKFNRYFAYNLLEGNLSEIEFSNGRTLPQPEFHSLITRWVNEGYEYELQDRFSRIKSFDSREDFEKVIRAIFHLANQKTKNPNFITRDLVGYEGRDLLSKLNNYDSNIERKFYPEPGGKDKHESFIRGLFMSANSPYMFEAEMASLINNDFSDDFGLKKEEFEKILIHYFKTYCEENGTLDKNTWRLFHSCRRTNREELGGGRFSRIDELLPDAKEIMRSIVQKNFDTFLLAMINPETFKQKLFAVSDFVISLYGGWKEFKELLGQMNEAEWAYLKEFKEFFDKFELNNFSIYVPFDFKVIPIHLRMRNSED